MNKTEVLLKYETCQAEGDKLPVIIVAAGSSSRMQGINKQFLELGGIPVIAKTLLKFESSSLIKNIILVVKADDIFSMQLLAEKYNITKISDIVCGGSNRQESVANGLKRLNKSDTKVLIHDGARPLVSNEIIRSVASALESKDAVACAVQVKDTVKQIDCEGRVVQTLERDSLVSVQTPQGVNIKKYQSAIQKVGDLSVFTDDMSIMEAAGYEVFCVEGSYDNIKITTPEDIALAQSIIGREE